MLRPQRVYFCLIFAFKSSQTALACAEAGGRRRCASRGWRGGGGRAPCSCVCAVYRRARPMLGPCSLAFPAHVSVSHPARHHAHASHGRRPGARGGAARSTAAHDDDAVAPHRRRSPPALFARWGPSVRVHTSCGSSHFNTSTLQATACGRAPRNVAGRAALGKIIIGNRLQLFARPIRTSQKVTTTPTCSLLLNFCFIPEYPSVNGERVAF